MTIMAVLVAACIIAFTKSNLNYREVSVISSNVEALTDSPEGDWKENLTELQDVTFSPGYQSIKGKAGLSLVKDTTNNAILNASAEGSKISIPTSDYASIRVYCGDKGRGCDNSHAHWVICYNGTYYKVY